jgi:hypothetical protein
MARDGLDAGFIQARIETSPMIRILSAWPFNFYVGFLTLTVAIESGVPRLFSIRSYLRPGCNCRSQLLK